MKRLTVRAQSRSCPVLVGRGILDDLGAALGSRHGAGQVILVCDENVAPLYLELSLIHI